MKPALIFYGNCQANALSLLFGSDASIAGAFSVHYLASFDDRIPGTSEIDPAAVASAAVLFEQFDPVHFPHRASLPPACVTITFPSVDFNLVWPLAGRNIFNDPPTPERLWGTFPYGDRIIVEAVKKGLALEEILSEYATTAVERLPNLDRFAELEWARLRARDAKCDVKIAEYVESHFRDINLFWCINHPTLEALRELCLRLIAAAARSGVAIPSGTLDQTLAALPPQGPLGILRVPIHPAVAEHFRLSWVPDATAKVYGLWGEPLTYDEYFRQMAECSIGVRDASPAAAAQ
jgi:hypothetical protein